MKNRIIKSLLAFIVSLAMVSGLFQTVALADPIMVGEDEESMADAEDIDNDEAMELVNSEETEGVLANPKTAARYLYDNALDELIDRVPTDEHDESLPEKYDLRDLGVVTPVKFQNPWGTCWGFSAIAASEISILSAMGKTYEETGLDLSEHHLAYFAKSYVDDGSSQDGEGIHLFDEADRFNLGGAIFTATSVFSSGMGPVDESFIPYRGTNSETYNRKATNFCYSPDDDWTIPSDYAYYQAYELVDSKELLSPAIYSIDVLEVEDPEEREEAYIGYDASATDAIKEEILAGRGVSICFAADMYLPSQAAAGGEPLFLNTEDNLWTHFTFDGTVSNHAVTIVGWDDTIPATSFLDHTDDEYGDGLAHQPEGDGAWIVKNSWGSATEEFPNKYSWGIEDENGDATGYFYISYYDRSLCLAESFEYNVEEKENPAAIIEQYDMMVTDRTWGWADLNGLQMANVFTAEADSDIKAVSCQTGIENTSTTYQIYLLDDDAVTPTEGTLAATLNVNYPNMGYHKEYLDTPVHVDEGQRYSVVITTCFQAGDDIYYEFAASTAYNEEYVNEYNRKIRYSYRNVSDESVYADELLKYYTKCVVNPGESYVYMNALGMWGDFSEIIPYLQEYDDYYGQDFDNFPIKAYLDFSDPAEAQAVAESYSTSELTYAEPATGTYMPYIFEKIWIIIGIVIGSLTVIFLIILGIRKFVNLRKQAAKVPELEKRIAELEGNATDADNSAEADTVSDPSAE